MADETMMTPDEVAKALGMRRVPYDHEAAMSEARRSDPKLVAAIEATREAAAPQKPH